MTEKHLWDEGAERTVLGAILLDPKALADADVLAEDFYHPAYAAVFEVMLELERASSPINAISIADRLRAQGRLDLLNSVGGEQLLSDVVLDVVTVSGIAFHARAIALKAERRRWIKATTAIRAQGLGASDDAEFLQEAERTLMALTTRRRAGSGPKRIKSFMGEVVKTIEKRYERRAMGAVTGIASALEELDAYTLGWQPGDLIIVAGRPSMGKTSLAMCAAVEAARAGAAVLVFSLEMSKEALAERMIAMEARVDSLQLKTGMIKPVTWAALSRSWGRIVEWPIWIDDEATPSVGEIRSRARRWMLNDAAAYERRLVIVDYIGLVKPNSKHAVREREVAEVSADLKAIAKDMRCPVIALSQLNRSLESRTDKRPMLSDLRESGALEQDADVVAFLYRDEKYHDYDNDGPSKQCKHCDRGVAEIIIAKQRNGDTGTAHVGWIAESTKFVNLTRRSEQ